MANLITTKLVGTDVLVRVARNAPKVIRRELTWVCDESTNAIKFHARGIVPVEEGDLKMAIEQTGRGLNWKTGIEEGPASGRTGLRSHTDPSIYGRYVEYGTARTAAKPFMRPAAEAERFKLPTRILKVAAKLAHLVKAA